MKDLYNDAAKASHARSTGKASVRALILWELQAGALAVRCLRGKAEGQILLQVRSERGWGPFPFPSPSNKNAAELLQIVAASRSLLISLGLEKTHGT